MLSLLDLIEMLEVRLGRKMTLRWADWRPGDQQAYVSDIRKLESRSRLEARGQRLERG